MGLDIGTSSSKAVVQTEDGVAVARASAPTRWTATPTGAQIDAHALLASALRALEEALADAPPGPVAGVGVAGIGESGVLLDPAGVPVGPVIAWHDTRDAAELADLGQRIDPALFARTTGLPLRHQWSLTKHRWLLAHHPGTAAAVRRLDVAAWVVRSLGGEEAAEQSLASRTGWLRLHSRDWWPETLAWAGAGVALLPDLAEAGTALGTVAAGAGPARLAGATLTVAGHDHQAAAIGAGALGAGDELDSCGTAEALVRSVAPGLSPETVGRLVAATVTVGWHALPGRWCLLGGTTGGLDLDRALGGLGLGVADVPALDRELAAGRPAGTETSRAGIGGAAETWRAALEAVTADAGAIHDAMSAVTGAHRALVVTGGWSHSAGLMAVKRRRFGALAISGVPEAAARGAALLAGLAAGSYATVDDLPVPA